MEKENLTFGEALELLKTGKPVYREGWNGKNQYIFLNNGSIDCPGLPDLTKRFEGIRGDLFVSGDKGISTRLPNINMKNVHGSTVTGWVPTQVDMLAEDWFVYG